MNNAEIQQDNETDRRIDKWTRLDKWENNGQIDEWALANRETGKWTNRHRQTKHKYLVFSPYILPPVLLMVAVQQRMMDKPL